VEGLENLRELLELVLDRNKIKSINDSSFVSQRRLQELHIEENRLRSLANLHHLENLLRLYVGMNRIQVNESISLFRVELFHSTRLIHFHFVATNPCQFGWLRTVFIIFFEMFAEFRR
jgi:Leucine-rich repeat (LRR) protein